VPEDEPGISQSSQVRAAAAEALGRPGRYWVRQRRSSPAESAEIDALPDGDIASGDPGGRADRSVSARGRPARGREARPERERVGQHCPGITGRSREMPGVATAVELYGEGGSDKEERLELRAVIAAARARQVPGAGYG
jgi:hypothetical protein